jgi:hypothetical protein
MKLLEKKFSKKGSSAKKARENIAGKVNSGIAKVQETFATFMDKKVNSLSLIKKKSLFYSFCFISFTCCFYLVLSPFFEKKKTKFERPQAIKFANHFDKPDKSITKENWISKQQYDHIHALKLYMDSLGRDVKGKVIYDSILIKHPKLMDSIKLFEEFYYLQK